MPVVSGVEFKPISQQSNHRAASDAGYHQARSVDSWPIKICPATRESTVYSVGQGISLVECKIVLSAL